MSLGFSTWNFTVATSKFMFYLVDFKILTPTSIMEPVRGEIKVIHHNASAIKKIADNCKQNSINEFIEGVLK